MSVPVEVGLTNPDPETLIEQPLQALVDQLRPLLTGLITASFIPYVIGSAVPAVEDQDKAWIRLDGAGRPGSLYVFYAGLWVKSPPDPGSYIGFYNGDPAIDFDANGRGLAGPGPVAMDYFGWHLMNGEDGVADLSDTIIVGGTMNDLSIGYDSGWVTQLAGAATGPANPMFALGLVQFTGYP